MAALGPGIVSERGLGTPDVNLVRCMGGPWSDQLTVLGCSEFRAKTNPMKQRRKIMAHFPARF